jgi:hypothetical protein
MRVPPSFLFFLIDSNISNPSILSFPFFSKWVSWTVNIAASTDLISDFKF